MDWFYQEARSCWFPLPQLLPWELSINHHLLPVQTLTLLGASDQVQPCLLMLMASNCRNHCIPLLLVRTHAERRKVINAYPLSSRLNRPNDVPVLEFSLCFVSRLLRWPPFPCPKFWGIFPDLAIFWEPQHHHCVHFATIHITNI